MKCLGHLVVFDETKGFGHDTGDVGCVGNMYNGDGAVLVVIKKVMVACIDEASLFRGCGVLRNVYHIIVVNM